MLRWDTNELSTPPSKEIAFVCEDVVLTKCDVRRNLLGFALRKIYLLRYAILVDQFANNYRYCGIKRFFSK
jgi:hypothetical protein